MIKRECPECGCTFETDDLRKKRCRKNCSRSTASINRARGQRRDAHVLEFIGVDGEGVTRPDGRHLYDMLSVGDRTLTSPDGGQLGWEEIFEFLWECFNESPTATYAGFFLGYDFTQWFRTLPENRAAMLLSPTGRFARRRTAPGTEHLGPFPVQAGDWEFDILGMKRFKLRKIGSDGSWMYVNDAGPFFQQSFLSVIDPGGWDEPVCSEDEFDLVVRGKSDRGIRMDAAAQLDARTQTIRYNTLENDILSRVLHRLNTGLVRAGIRLRRTQWYGPGQAAQAWMTRIEAPTAETVAEVVPADALRAARDSYYGGWFEIFAHGHVPCETYEYDINSAYPAMIAELPCLEHGEWRRRDGMAGVGGLDLVHAEVWGTDPIVGTMLHRERDGRVHRPGHTKGWYWWPELLAAHRAGVIDRWEIDDSWSYHGCFCPPPFKDEMRWLYQARLDAGKNTPEGKAYKLVYNSAYGKLAQSIGAPKFANPVYASLITSGTRKMILEAIATHPRRSEDLLMVATDGVYFRTRHPALDIDPARLGAWDETVKHNLTLLMPGVYWDDTTRNALKDGESPKLKSRGVSARDLAACIGELDQAFVDLRPDGRWPAVKIPLAFSMITATQALHRGRWETAGTLTPDEKAIKKLSADPSSKRAGVMYDDHGIWRMHPYAVGARLESTPYAETFGMQDVLGGAEEGITPEGLTITQALREAIL